MFHWEEETNLPYRRIPNDLCWYSWLQNQFQNVLLEYGLNIRPPKNRVWAGGNGGLQPSSLADTAVAG